MTPGGEEVALWAVEAAQKLMRDLGYGPTPENILLRKAISAALLAEREACANVAKHLNGWGADCGRGGHAMHIADAIRSRKP